MTETIAPTARRKGRSPAYPAISLEKAIQRARLVHDAEGTYKVPVSSVVSKWGYSSLNGPASLTVSALKKFGLFDDEGNKAERTVAVTDLAVRILKHPNPEERQAAIREAALCPSIHMEMWEQYGTKLPSDETLEWRLTRDRGFTQTGAREFVREWRETMTFAGLGDTASPVPENLEESQGAAEQQRSDGAGADPSIRTPDLGSLLGWPAASPELPASPPASEQRPSAASQTVQSYPIPIALHGRPPVVVSGAFPLSETEWEQFKVVLDAMKPVLVGNPTPTTVVVDPLGEG